MFPDGSMKTISSASRTRMSSTEASIRRQPPLYFVRRQTSTNRTPETQPEARVVNTSIHPMVAPEDYNIDKPARRRAANHLSPGFLPRNELMLTHSTASSRPLRSRQATDRAFTQRFSYPHHAPNGKILSSTTAFHNFPLRNFRY